MIGTALLMGTKTHADIYVPPPQVISKPYCDPIKATGQDPADCFYRQPAPKITPKAYGFNCVQFAKAYLGRSGTWGNGGRLLSLNSSPVPNAVVIFKYTHVAIVQEVTASQILIIESNYKRGQTSLRWLSLTDPTIRGYHLF